MMQTAISQCSDALRDGEVAGRCGGHCFAPVGIIGGLGGAAVVGDGIGGGAGGGEWVVRGSDAGGQHGGIEVDVAAWAVGLGNDLVRRQGADLDGAAVGRPGFAGVGGGVARIGDGDGHGPARGGGGDALGDFLFEEIGARAWRVHRPEAVTGCAAGISDQRTVWSAPAGR